MVAEFDAWVERVTSNCGASVAAFGFLLYEHEDSFAVQLVGAARYVDSDPFGSEVLCSSGEDLLDLPRTTVGPEWQQGLAAATQLVRSYLARRARGGPFDGSTVAVGFVDGDMKVLQSAATPNSSLHRT
ncbi:MAG: hypothetical protein ABI779_22760 [Acidobacteriota bacterium]